jgi:hypothetical protein
MMSIQSHISLAYPLAKDQEVCQKNTCQSVSPLYGAIAKPKVQTSCRYDRVPEDTLVEANVKSNVTAPSLYETVFVSTTHGILA